MLSLLLMSSKCSTESNHEDHKHDDTAVESAPAGNTQDNAGMESDSAPEDASMDAEDNPDDQPSVPENTEE